MLNNLILVGRVVEDAKITTLDSGLKVANVTLAVQRPFKNEEDSYDTDFIPVQFWQGIAELASEYCTKGSVIGVKGRIAIRINESGEKKIRVVDIIGERLSFISTVKRQEAE